MMDGLADTNCDTQAISANKDAAPKPTSKKATPGMSAEEKKNKILSYILWCVRSGFPLSPAKKLQRLEAALATTKQKNNAATFSLN
jgi:hypothetical protein